MSFRPDLWRMRKDGRPGSTETFRVCNAYVSKRRVSHSMYTITRCLPLLCLLACEYSDTTGDPLRDAFYDRADATLSDVASGLDSTLDMFGADRLVIDMGVPDMLIDGPRDGALDGSSDSTPVPLDVGMDTGTLEQLDLSIREPPDLGAIPDIGEVEPDQAIPQPMNVWGRSPRPCRGL